MNRLHILTAALAVTVAFPAAVRSAEPDKAPAPRFHNAYYDCRRAAHQREGMPEGAIVFLGNSITEQGWWNVLIPKKKVVNRGIGGDNTYGMLDRLPEILAFAPRKIFLMAGINDLTAGYPVDTIATNIAAIIETIHTQAPRCEVYIQSVLTPNDEVLAYTGIKGKHDKVRELNARIETICRQKGATFVDLAPLLSDARGQVRTELTKDGIHIHPEAYRIWVDYLKKKKYLK